MNNFGVCELNLSDSKILLKENNSSIIFINSKKRPIKKVKIDGCYITNGLRCDYLIIDHNGHEHFVELKGADVEHAIKQIEKTITNVSVNYQQHPKHSYIVSTRCPLISPQIQCLQVTFKKKYNSTLKIKNIHHEVELI